MRAPGPLPGPPQDLFDRSGYDRGSGVFSPALDLEEWVCTEILTPDRPLSNYDHEHLFGGAARIGFLWTTERFAKKGRRVLGTAQLGEPTGQAWSAGRQRQQLVRWFGAVPDFLVTLDAWFVREATEAGRVPDALALIEHELYHCGQDTTADGDPRFDRDGEPVWGIRPHDVEEFGGVIRRYGIEASAAGPLVEAADFVREHGPAVALADLGGICGVGRAA